MVNWIQIKPRKQFLIHLSFWIKKYWNKHLRQVVVFQAIVTFFLLTKSISFWRGVSHSFENRGHIRKKKTVHAWLTKSSHSWEKFYLNFKSGVNLNQTLFDQERKWTLYFYGDSLWSITYDRSYLSYDLAYRLKVP